MLVIMLTVYGALVVGCLILNLRLNTKLGDKLNRIEALEQAIYGDVSPPLTTVGKSPGFERAPGEVDRL